ncbi:HIRAN domain-containing protein, partial [Nonomuraea sp. NPDC049784]|uniref:HIRAN domain-containing protein n=1 Tax=Nonomuraea sp. NPDC049784 TaxID=3154361 RepID=UPI0033DC7EF5
TGLSLSGCADARTAAQTLAAQVDLDPELLTDDGWPDLRHLLLRQAITVAELHRSASQERISDIGVLVDVSTDWMDGLAVDELRRRHGARLGPDDPMRFVKVLDRLVVHDLAWVISAIVQLWEHERDGLPLPGPVTACAAMIKYGVDSESACFAASIGVRNRRDAIALGQLYAALPGEGFAHFLSWAAALTPDAVASSVSRQTARLFLDRAAVLLTPRQAVELAVAETGTLTVPVRGIGPLGTASLLAEAHSGDLILLRRERDNLADPNAIAVHLPSGQHVGYLAREIAHIMAPLLDLDEGPSIHAVIETLPHRRTPAALARRDAVSLRIELS